MSRFDKVYYAFIQKGNWFEFHVSRDKKDVESCKALSRKIPCDSPGIEDFIQGCRFEVQNLKLVEVKIN